MNVRRLTLLSLLVLVFSGCYEVAWYYPAPGQGSLVSNGERLGVAHRLSGDTPESQSFLVLSVKEAYTADAGKGLSKTIIQVTVNLVNAAAAPARLDVSATQLEVGGRSIPAKWVYRTGGVTANTPREQRDEVAPNMHARFDLFFDLGAYPARLSGYTVPPLTGGIPLLALREFHVSWGARWAGKDQKGKVRFFRDQTGMVGSGWSAAPGPFWGFGWWGWPYAWPSGGVVIHPHFPWRTRPSGPHIPRRPHPKAPMNSPARTIR
jgi:hypothetical protein